jgi:hypothetical protein
MVPYDDVPDKPPCSPGAADPDGAPAPDAQTVFAYAFSSVIDRMVLISDHLAAIEEALVDVTHHQDIITHHCSALKSLLEREIP